jgi:acyl-CoA synthetase (AMP-forming)/AMP-acid ligase II
MGSIQQTLPYGRRLVPVLIDEIAQQTPKRVFCSIPKSSNLRDGFLDITFQDFARATNRTAGWLEENFGRSYSFETLAYIGPSDLRYLIMVLAASKVGYKVGTFHPQL